MNLSFGAVRAIDAGIWVGALSAGEAAKLPGAPLRVAGPHVVLVTDPAWNGRELQAPYLGVSVLALGAGNDAIYVRAGYGHAGCQIASNCDPHLRQNGAVCGNVR